MLGMKFALIHKEHKNNNGNNAGDGSPNEDENTPNELMSPVSNLVLVGKVRGKVCILVDDLADTSNTITRAADLLVARGAVKVYAIITHGILSGSAVERIKASKLDELIVSNTVPQSEHIRHCSKIRVFDVAALFAEAVRRIHNGESVSALFQPIEI